MRLRRQRHTQRESALNWERPHRLVKRLHKTVGRFVKPNSTNWNFSIDQIAQATESQKSFHVLAQPHNGADGLLIFYSCFSKKLVMNTNKSLRLLFCLFSRDRLICLAFRGKKQMNCGNGHAGRQQKLLEKQICNEKNSRSRKIYFKNAGDQSCWVTRACEKKSR